MTKVVQISRLILFHRYAYKNIVKKDVQLNYVIHESFLHFEEAFDLPL